MPLLLGRWHRWGLKAGGAPGMPTPWLCAIQEECQSWDVNEVVFSPALWPTYHHLMRSDFRLFDEYVYEHEGGCMAAWNCWLCFQGVVLRLTPAGVPGPFGLPATHDTWT
jgi:hypothetical protein